MCLIAFSIGLDERMPVRLASNRDEFFARPTAAMHRWRLDNGTEVLAGRDLREGGTWLGISGTGRVAMLTNVRSPKSLPGQRSRGELVTGWLGSCLSVEEWLGALAGDAYGGFNLVLGDWDGTHWHWVSNRDPDDPHTDHSTGLFQRPLSAGTYGLSNASLNSPWPKTDRLRAAVAAQSDAQVLQTLADREPAPTPMLPRTGVPDDIESALSSPFVQMSERSYGTRSSLLLQIDREPSVHGGRLRASLREWTHPVGVRHAWSAAPPLVECWTLT